jgi:hypothetical protein
MTQRFQFNQKNRNPVVVEGMRVDMVRGVITVVDEQGQPKVSFTEDELSSWYRVFSSTIPA